MRRPAHRRATACALLAACLAAAPLRAARRTPPREEFRADTRLAAPRMPAPPVIDGRLADGEWDAAAALTAAIDETGRPAGRNVTWYFAWDADCLYLACRSPRSAAQADRDAARPPFELYVTSAKARLHLRALADGARRMDWSVRGRDPNAPDPNVRLAMSHGADALAVEVAVTVADLGASRGNRGGQAWHILPVRNFAGPLPAAVTPPCATGQARKDGRNHPRVVLGGGEGWARAEVGAAAPAGEAARAAVALVAPPGRAAAARATARLFDAGLRVGRAEGALRCEQGGRATWSPKLTARSAPTPRAGGERRFDLTVAHDKHEILHVHVTVDPLLGASAASARRAERTLTVKPPGGIPPAFADRLRPYRDLPEGHALCLTLGRRAGASGEAAEVLLAARPLNARGQKAGLERWYAADGSRVVRTVEYADGRRNGTERVYDAGGRLRVEIPWTDGVIEGVRRAFAPDGGPVSETPYTDGVASGKALYYDEQQRVTLSAEQRGGIRTGEQIEYWPRRIKRVAPYDHGKVDGTVLDYWDNGQIKMSRPFRDDRLHGIEKHYDRNGKLTQTRYWSAGDLVTESEYRAESSSGR
jgi:antitoxin component YwqK of YwqJK toxin-antitoxin module